MIGCDPMVRQKRIMHGGEPHDQGCGRRRCQIFGTMPTRRASMSRVCCSTAPTCSAATSASPISAAATPRPSSRERSADRRAGRGAVGQGLRRRHRLDEARRLLDALHGQARSLKSLYRGLAHEDEMVALSALHLQSQSARGLDRHAAARLRAAPPCRSHASRCGHRHRRLAEPEDADRRRSSAARSAGCRGSGRASISA